MTITSCSEEKSHNIDTVDISNDWQLFSSEDNEFSGDVISLNGFEASKSYTINVPTTVLNALVDNGVYDSVYVGLNLEKIDKKQFQQPWWYRNVFSINNIGQNYELNFEGINYKANIWLNGKIIADTTEVNNAFKMYSFDITSLLTEGDNVLAVEVFAPIAGDFSIGFVDWNPSPADQNMGIFRAVTLNAINKVQIFNPYVESYFKNDDYNTAFHNVSMSLKNYTNSDIKGAASVNINGKLIIKNV